MNEGENRNLESQNLSSNNQLNTYNNMNNPQPNGNYNYSNNYNVSNNTSEPKKNNNLIIIILLLIILGLAGYIIYDKVIAEKDANNNQENVNNNENNNQTNNNNENNQVNNNDNNQDHNLNEKNIVFEKNINGKNIKVEYKISVSDKTDPWIICDLFINGNKEDSWQKDLYPAGADGFSEDEINSDINDFIETVNSDFASNVGIVKGDKDYLYILSGGYAPNKMLILNENAEIVTNEDIIPNDVNAVINPGQNCQKYASYNSKSYFIDENAIYYLKPAYSEAEKTYANEYKLTFADNKVIKEKIGTCESDISGEKDFIHFEDEQNN